MSDPATAPAVSVVVVSHDSAATLPRCVAAALSQAPTCELLLVDNASRDSGPAAVPADPRVRLLLNPHNRGFAAACNQGAARARGRLLLFLNPDCFLPEGALTALVERLQAAPSIGLLGAQLLGADGSVQRAARRRDPSALAAVARALGLEGRFGLPRVEIETGAGEAGTIDVDAVSGALMLLRREAFDAVGGFDAGYVLHFEDLDLCRRLRAAGWRVALAADLRVPHLKGTSSGRRPVWVAWQKHRGMLRYYRRFDAGRSWPADLLMPVLVWIHFLLVALPRAAWRRLQAGRGPADDAAGPS